MRKLNVFLFLLLHEAKRTLRASPDSDLLFCEEPEKQTANTFISYHSGFVWLTLCGSTSNDFVEFNKVGVDTIIVSIARYQTWVGQSGTTSIPSALSCFTFEKALGMTKIGWMLKTLNDTSQFLMHLYILPLDPAEMLHICLNFALILVINKSISGLKYTFSNSRFKNFEWGIHSVSTRLDRDFFSGTVFSFPGMQAAKRWFLWVISHSQIFRS